MLSSLVFSRRVISSPLCDHLRLSSPYLIMLNDILKVLYCHQARPACLHAAQASETLRRDVFSASSGPLVRASRSTFHAQLRTSLATFRMRSFDWFSSVRSAQFRVTRFVNDVPSTPANLQKAANRGLSLSSPTISFF